MPPTDTKVLEWKRRLHQYGRGNKVTSYKRDYREGCGNNASSGYQSNGEKDHGTKYGCG